MSATARHRPHIVQYYQDGGVGFVNLYRRWGGNERQLIPAEALFHTDADHQDMKRLVAAAGPPAAEPVPPASPDSPDRSFIRRD